MRRVFVGVAVAVLCACADGFAPPGGVRFTVLPVFQSQAVLTNDLDLLGVRITRIPAGSVVLDTTAAVDSAGNVDLAVSVSLVSQADTFELRVQGIRSSDGAVLYEGFDTVGVSATATAPVSALVPVAYVGPCGPASGCTVTLGPQSAQLALGASLTMTVAVDSLGQPVAGVPVAFENLTPTLISLGSDLTVTALPATTGGAASVVASIPGDADTLRLSVVSALAPVISPGYAAVLLGGTIQLTAGAAGATWISRAPGVASVSTGGLVMGAGRGTAVIVATSGGGSDSIVVLVGDPASPGDVLAFAAAGGRSFATRPVGQAVPVDVVLEQVAAGSLVGSYKARLTWSSSVLRYDSTSGGAFPLPTINVDTAAAGVLVFAAVDADGSAGQPVLARVWFTALAAGPDNRALQILEVSGVSPTFTNYWLLGRYLVASGAVRVIP